METRSHKVVQTPDKATSDKKSADPKKSAEPPTTNGAKDESSSDSTYASLEVRRPDPDAPQTRTRRARSSQIPQHDMQPGASNSMRQSTNGARPYPAPMRPEDNVAIASSGSRAFPCPLAIYGCTSTFGSKNEWKRHVNTQHMRLGFWRCDQCPNDGNRGPNDFNRKDLFIQHIRRMHSGSFKRASAGKPGKDDAEEAALQEIAARCYRHIRSPPESSACLFCDQKFHGIGSWDDRMEHVGRHMEVAKREGANIAPPQEWKADESTHQWMANELIIAPHGDQWALQELENQAWPGNPTPATNAGPPSASRATPRHSIPGKRSSSYNYQPIQQANHIPHTPSVDLQPIAPSPAVQPPTYQPIQPQPRDAEPHGIGLVSAPNGLNPYMQEPEEERPAKRRELHSPNDMMPPERYGVDCDWPDCNRRGVYGFSTREAMVEHFQEAHATQRVPETRQSTPQVYSTPPQLQPQPYPQGVKRPITQDGPQYRPLEPHPPRPPPQQQQWTYPVPPERPPEPHVMMHAPPQDPTRRNSVPDHVRAMPPMQNGAVHGYHPGYGQHMEQPREHVLVHEHRPDVEMMYSHNGPPSQHYPPQHMVHEIEDEEREERDADRRAGVEEIEEEEAAQDHETDRHSPLPGETRTISHLPRWRDEYGYKYCSTQDLTENDIFEMRERSQDLEMVLANVWQAFVRTGSNEAQPWSPLSQLVRRFAPNILVTASQPGGMPPPGGYYPQQH